ncbi:MAG: LysR family transcriptional regulator [Gammaproteobacteria bacterium]|nr:LysR family transcriptional regulator [Gammaproteobacteria bacterium]
MKLTLDALNVLDAIDQGGSFAAAAEGLYRVPSAISYTMQKLEQDLGTPIFDRSGHRAVLTSAGKTLLREGRRLLLAAHELEGQVKRIATGWETELRIAMDTLIPANNLLSLIAGFYTEHTPAKADDPATQNNTQNKSTQLRLQQEVLGGTWDALVSNRADLVIGATGDAPAGAGYSHFALNECSMVFVVAPGHPLATAEEPISSTDILKYRAVAIADSSRYLPPRSSGLLTGQEVLTVPDMASKLEAQIQGLGIGYLPLYWAQAAIDARQLLVRSVEATPGRATQQIAWRSDNQGKALKWFVDKLRQPAIQKRLLSCHQGALFNEAPQNISH